MLTLRWYFTFKFRVSGSIVRTLPCARHCTRTIKYEKDNEWLNRCTPCHGYDDKQLVEAVAIVHVELILIHPFRDGNGHISK